MSKKVKIDLDIQSSVILPETVSPLPSFKFNESGNDTGLGSDGDGEIFFSNNGSEGMRLNGSHNLNVVGNIAAANFPIVKSINTLAYFDAAGEVQSLPGWNAASTGLVGNYLTYTVPDDAGGNIKMHANETELTLLQDVTAWSFANWVQDCHFDRSAHGFNWDNGITNFSMNTSMEGQGTVTSATAINSSLSFGVGTSGTTTNGFHAQFTSQIGADYTVGTFSGVGIGLNIVPLGTVTGNVIMNSSNLNIDGSILGYVGTSLISINGNVGGGVDLVSNVMTGNVGNNFRASYNQLNGNVTNGVSGYEFNYSGTAGASFNGSKYSLNGAASSYTGYYSSTQGTITNQIEHLTLNSSASASSYFALNGNNTGNIVNDINIVNYTNSGTANGAQGLNFSNTGNLINFFKGVTLSNSGTNDNSQGYNLNDTSTSATSKQGMSINLGGSSPQVSGIQVNVSNATSVNRKQAGGFEGGTLAHQATFTTSSSSPFFVDPINYMVPTLHVESGTPISGTDPVMYFIGGTLQAEDDLGTSGFGLGFVGIANLSQAAVTATKTVQKFNCNIAGVSIPDLGQGVGSITDVYAYRALGAISGGGNATITNMYGFYVDSFLTSLSPTNAWAFYDGSSNADNYLGKLAIGTSSKKVSGSNLLEVEGDSYFIGNVGVNTATPAAALHVVGDAVISNNLTVSSLGAGIVSSNGAGLLSAGGITASNISNVPAGDISASNVQAAIDELDTEKAKVTNIQIFTSSGTWTKPAGAKAVEVILLGAGGGGGSGRRAANGGSNIRCGGGGGASAVFSTRTFAATSLASSETITVGAGGTGGAGKSSDGDGNTGVAGGDTTFGAWLKGLGGAAGTGGTNAAGTGGAATVTIVTPWNAAQRQGASASATGGNAGAAGMNEVTPTAGGGGGGLNTSDVSGTGSAGGVISANVSDNLNLAGGTAGGVAPAAGGAGNNATWVYGLQFGTGGGGSRGGTSTASGNGGAGGKGAGGGGAGAVATGFTGGNGGAGGDGWAIVVTYF